MTEEVKFRESQARILTYKHGLMSVLAVPGSGKTFTLSHLAAKLVLELDLALEQEILVVTFSNTAVDNFSARIGSILNQKGFIAGYGYKVRTLHGLANDILKERPDLVGLTNHFGIVDGDEGERILRDIVRIKMVETPEVFDALLDPSLNSKKRQEIFENADKLPEQIYRIASAYIRTAKDHLFSETDLREKLNSISQPSDFLLTCQSIFEDYQAALRYRGAVDFDDLIRLAWIALNSDEKLLQTLQQKWPIILEDEAQDSSIMQESILRLLSSKSQNWVRVGDPNQSINESFTTATPKLLRSFSKRSDVSSESLPESGRSCLEIMQLANELNSWSQQSHPNINIRDALSDPIILPTSTDDVQSNPPCQEPALELIEKKMSPEEEKEFLIRSVRKWIEEHPHDTLAVLAQTNKRVGILKKALEDSGLPVIDDLMKNPDQTLNTAGAIFLILHALLEPTIGSFLSNAFNVVNKAYRQDEERKVIVEKCSQFIKTSNFVENILYPKDGVYNYAFENLLEDEKLFVNDLLSRFVLIVRRWHKASILPIDQLILTIAQDLFLTPAELAIAHKLSQLAKQLREENPDWKTEDILKEIERIARNQRGLTKVSNSAEGFNPDNYPGQVVVSTFHKSKGLEWDKVFLTSLNTFDFPSGDIDDHFLSEQYYFTDPKNKQAEIVAELENILLQNGANFKPGQATLLDRNNVARERLRLLYVGITRAKRSLTMTWNTGYKQSEAVAFKALCERGGHG